MARFMEFNDSYGKPVLINLDTLLRASPTVITRPGMSATGKEMTSLTLAPGIGEVIDFPYAKFARFVTEGAA